MMNRGDTDERRYVVIFLGNTIINLKEESVHDLRDGRH